MWRHQSLMWHFNIRRGLSNCHCRPWSMPNLCNYVSVFIVTETPGGLNIFLWSGNWYAINSYNGTVSAKNGVMLYLLLPYHRVISFVTLGKYNLSFMLRLTYRTSNRKFRSWWRHQMQTFSALLAICAGNSPVNGEFHIRAELWYFLWFAPG